MVHVRDPFSLFLFHHRYDDNVILSQLSNSFLYWYWNITFVHLRHYQPLSDHDWLLRNAFFCTHGRSERSLRFCSISSATIARGALSRIFHAYITQYQRFSVCRKLIENDISSLLPTGIRLIRCKWNEFQLLLWLGCVDAGSSTAHFNLKRGRSILIFVGGEREQLLTTPGEHIIFLSTRKGFIKLALEYGVNLVPMVSRDAMHHIKLHTMTHANLRCRLSSNTLSFSVCFRWERLLPRVESVFRFQTVAAAKFADRTSSHLRQDVHLNSPQSANAHGGSFARLFLKIWEILMADVTCLASQLS